MAEQDYTSNPWPSPTVSARQAPVQVYDAKDGSKWRGGVVRAIVGDVAIVEVLAEVGSPRRYRGPAGSLKVASPICCRMVGTWPYEIAELRESFWASGAEEAEAARRTPGIFGYVPWAILEADGKPRMLWREDVTATPTGLLL